MVTRPSSQSCCQNNPEKSRSDKPNTVYNIMITWCTHIYNRIYLYLNICKCLYMFIYLNLYIFTSLYIDIYIYLYLYLNKERNMCIYIYIIIFFCICTFFWYIYSISNPIFTFQVGSTRYYRFVAQLLGHGISRHDLPSGGQRDSVGCPGAGDSWRGEARERGGPEKSMSETSESDVEFRTLTKGGLLLGQNG